MAYLKDHYSFDEVVTRLSEHDPSITCTDDVVDFVRAGKLESQVLIEGCYLIPVDSCFDIEEVSLTAGVLRAVYDYALQKESNIFFKKHIKYEYKRELKKIRQSGFMDFLLGCFECVRPICRSDIEDVDIQNLRFDSEDIESFKGSERLPAIFLSVPVLVSPIGNTPALTTPFAYLEFYDEIDNDSPVMGVSLTYEEMAMAVMTGYTKCKTNFGSGSTPTEFYIVNFSSNNMVMDVGVYPKIIGNSVLNGRVYITRDSIQSFEEKYLGINHSIDDFPAKKGKPDKQKGTTVQVRREAVFSAWLKDQEDIKVVKCMTKAEVWKILQGVDAELFSANMKGFFKEQTLIKFNSGRRQRS